MRVPGRVAGGACLFRCPGRWGPPCKVGGRQGRCGCGGAWRMCLSWCRLGGGGVRRPARVIDALVEVSMPWRDHQRSTRGIVHTQGRPQTGWTPLLACGCRAIRFSLSVRHFGCNLRIECDVYWKRTHGNNLTLKWEGGNMVNVQCPASCLPLNFEF